jgi:hypothetical protein
MSPFCVSKRQITNEWKDPKRRNVDAQNARTWSVIGTEVKGSVSTTDKCYAQINRTAYVVERL